MFVYWDTHHVRHWMDLCAEVTCGHRCTRTARFFWERLWSGESLRRWNKDEVKNVYILYILPISYKLCPYSLESKFMLPWSSRLLRAGWNYLLRRHLSESLISVSARGCLPNPHPPLSMLLPKTRRTIFSWFLLLIRCVSCSVFRQQRWCAASQVFELSAAVCACVTDCTRFSEFSQSGMTAFCTIVVVSVCTASSILNFKCF